MASTARLPRIRKPPMPPAQRESLPDQIVADVAAWGEHMQRKAEEIRALNAECLRLAAVREARWAARVADMDVDDAEEAEGTLEAVA